MHDELSAYAHYLSPLKTGETFRGSISGRLRVVLFDIYGTLFISGSGDLGTAMQHFETSTPLAALLRDHHIKDPPDRLAQKLWKAIKRHHVEARQRGVDYPEIEIDRIWQSILRWPDHQRMRRFAEAYEMIVNPVFPMPGAEQVLRTLRRRGRELGVISNAQFFTPNLFGRFLGDLPQALGFSDELLIYSYRLGCAKPSPLLFRHAVDVLDRRGIAPQQALFVGNDMQNDILPAAQVGFKTALFAGDRRSLRWDKIRKADRARPPDLVITELRQLLNLPALAV